jgi:hypothetical protein
MVDIITLDIIIRSRILNILREKHLHVIVVNGHCLLALMDNVNRVVIMDNMGHVQMPIGMVSWFP